MKDNKKVYHLMCRITNLGDYSMPSDQGVVLASLDEDKLRRELKMNSKYKDWDDSFYACEYYIESVDLI